MLKDMNAGVLLVGNLWKILYDGLKSRMIGGLQSRLVLCRSKPAEVSQTHSPSFGEGKRGASFCALLTSVVIVEPCQDAGQFSQSGDGYGEQEIGGSSARGGPE